MLFRSEPVVALPGAIGDAIRKHYGTANGETAEPGGEPKAMRDMRGVVAAAQVGRDADALGALDTVLKDAEG